MSENVESSPVMSNNFENVIENNENIGPSEVCERSAHKSSSENYLDMLTKQQEREDNISFEMLIGGRGEARPEQDRNCFMSPS